MPHPFAPFLAPPPFFSLPRIPPISPPSSCIFFFFFFSSFLAPPFFHPSSHTPFFIHLCASPFFYSLPHSPLFLIPFLAPPFFVPFLAPVRFHLSSPLFAFTLPRSLFCTLLSLFHVPVLAPFHVPFLGTTLLRSCPSPLLPFSLSTLPRTLLLLLCRPLFLCVASFPLSPLSFVALFLS